MAYDPGGFARRLAFPSPASPIWKYNGFDAEGRLCIKDLRDGSVFVDKSPLNLDSNAAPRDYGDGFCWLGLVAPSVRGFCASKFGRYPKAIDLWKEFPRLPSMPVIDWEVSEPVEGHCGRVYHVDVVEVSFEECQRRYAECKANYGVPGFRPKANHFSTPSLDIMKTLRMLSGCNTPWASKGDATIGAFVDLVADRSKVAEERTMSFAHEVLDSTDDLASDAAMNYKALGLIMENVNRRGGFSGIARAKFIEVVFSLVGRWAGDREARAASVIAAEAVYGKVPWSPLLFEEAMDVNESEEEKQIRMVNMAGMFLRGEHVDLHKRELREGFNAWRADFLTPARSFARAFGVAEQDFDAVVHRVSENAVPLVKSSMAVVASAGLTTLKAAAIVAAGGFLTASVVMAAGILLDVYYDNVEQIRLSPSREMDSVADWVVTEPSRSKEYFAVGAALSDEHYDLVDSTSFVRFDPFFFSIKSEVAQLKDDTAAQRLIANTILAPLINTMGSQNKTVVLLPATISTDSANHIQKAMPSFYFRIVDRMHSHPELWAVRRSFELLVSKKIALESSGFGVVLVGGNVRQVSKIPNVICNYGPLLSGRDEARRRLGGTVNQRKFYNDVTLDGKFGIDGAAFKSAMAVAFYSVQNFDKREFILSCIHKGISKAFVSVNMPVIMQDSRIFQWDDNVLGVRYVRRINKLSMAVLNSAVDGYDDCFDNVMSWSKPITPIYGYDVSVDCIAQVGSSYLLEIAIGCGPQESHDTIWKMPDAGHYVLQDLTRESEDFVYFPVPAAKFDQVVKFVVQLSGAKNVFEATTGRILGLEASIKIGGVTLERSWTLNHNEFVSVAVHAMICAGIDKSDALLALSNLRSFHSSTENLTFWGKAIRGYCKLFSLGKDLRKPGLAPRGRHDYQVVKHWVARQCSGLGWSKPWDTPHVNLYGAGTTGVFSSDQGVVVGVQTDCGVKIQSKKRLAVDEGYVTASDLNSDDSDGASTDEGANVLDTLSKFKKIKTSVSDALFGVKQANYPSLGKVLDVSDELSIDCYTISQFDPFGPLSFDSDVVGLSKAAVKFSQEVQNLEILRKMVDEGRTLYAPDSGISSILDMCLNKPALSFPRSDSSFGFVKTTAIAQTDLEKLDFGFEDEISDFDFIHYPFVVIDGVAGSAKSSFVRDYVNRRRKDISSVVVCPTKVLAKEWRNSRIGPCVTRHKLTMATLRNRNLLIIDECYAYTKRELNILFAKACKAGVPVLCLGDRRQQFLDGAEIAPSDFEAHDVSIIRLLVSNTMPIDSVVIARWCASSDYDRDMIQTRNAQKRSILFSDQNSNEVNGYFVDSGDQLLRIKDRLDTPLEWKLTEKELGFPENRDALVSIARSQGLRAIDVALATSRVAKIETWLADQKGLFYVSCTRHSRRMLFTCNMNDLIVFKGLFFVDAPVVVNGRLAVLENKQDYYSPMYSIGVNEASARGKIVDKLVERGMWPELQSFSSLGPRLNDWRPGVSAFAVNSDASLILSSTMLHLIDERTPYIESQAAAIPHFRDAVGLYSIRRPALLQLNEIKSIFPGMSRLAVNQSSKDELLDLKNVVERTARPRTLMKSPGDVNAQAAILFDRILKVVFVEDSLPYSLGPMVQSWASTRSSDFVGKFSSDDPYGLTSFTTKSQGFLKTQVKVKVKRDFALEENYGQTVLASPSGFNGIFGPWSKMFLRNVRLACRRGVILDSGYSDKDVAHDFRSCGVLPNFMNCNYQADVKKQDTSHNPVTLRVFCNFLEYFGVPKELSDLYLLHSSKFEYQSLHNGLYRGVADHNLGSGDPFTLIRNIFEVLTVLVDRFDLSDLMASNFIVKGDDLLMDKICRSIGSISPDIANTQLTQLFNAPPYHAGRFFLPDSVIPDPARMICKLFSKQDVTVDKRTDLLISFYDKYISLSDEEISIMKQWLPIVYNDLSQDLCVAMIDMYVLLRDKNVAADLLTVNAGDGLNLKFDIEKDCASYALSFFEDDVKILQSVRFLNRKDFESKLFSLGVPFYGVNGNDFDFKKQGIWLTDVHAWAVIGATDYKIRIYDESISLDIIDSTAVTNSYKCLLDFGK